MRQERIRKTPRRSSRHVEFPPLSVARQPSDTGSAEDVLARINDVLEAA